MAKGKNPAGDGAPPADASAEAPTPEVTANVADAGVGAPPQEGQPGTASPPFLPPALEHAAEPVGEAWAQPVPTEAERLAAHEAWLLQGLAHLKTDMDNVHAELEAIARAAAVILDHAKHVKFSQLANVVAEFRNGLAQ